MSLVLVLSISLTAMWTRVLIFVWNLGLIVSVIRGLIVRLEYAGELYVG